MNGDARRRRILLALLLLLLLIALLVARCRCAEPAPAAPPPTTATPAAPEPAEAAGPVPATEAPAEVIGPVTLVVPERVLAGATFTVAWRGPDNAGDYVTLVAAGAPDAEYANYRETREGAELELRAPVEPGAHEVRYVTGRSRTVLARAPLEVFAAEATLTAPDEVVLGAPVTVEWTGPDHAGDYVTIVMAGTQDGVYGNYTNTERGSPLTVTAPTTAGDAEVRYVTGQGDKVLARRPLRIRTAEVSLSAPDEAVAGATIQVEWTGPDNAGDYLTVVEPGAPDASYGNYVETKAGSPLALRMPVTEGAAELRYVAAQGRRVLARRPIRLVPAEVTLSAPAEAAAGTRVEVAWTGPAHEGDYITIVPAGAGDEQYGDYEDAKTGSPSTLTAPKAAGDAEIRYVAGQGRKVLARRAIRITE